MGRGMYAHASMSSFGLLGLSACVAGVAAFHSPAPIQLRSSGPTAVLTSAGSHARLGLRFGASGFSEGRGRRLVRTSPRMQRQEDSKGTTTVKLQNGEGQEKIVSVPAATGVAASIPDGAGEFEISAEGASASVWITRMSVLLVAFLYGTNFGVVKLMGEQMSTSTAAALRFTLAAVALSPLLGQLRKEVIPAGLEIGFWVTLGYIVQAVGLETVEASKMGFLCALIVVVCPVIEKLAGGNITKGQWSSVALAVLGAGFLELGGPVQPAMGDVFGLLQPVGFGIALWKCEVVQKEYPDQGGALTAIQLIVTMLASWAWVAYDSHGLPPVETITSAFSTLEMSGAVLWTGLITTALTVFLQTVSVSKLSSQEATVLISTEPVWAALFASYLLGENIGPNAFIGGGLIVGACIFSIFADKVFGEEAEEQASS